MIAAPEISGPLTRRVLASAHKTSVGQTFDCLTDALLNRASNFSFDARISH